jgi:DNA repair photolyase
MDPKIVIVPITKTLIKASPGFAKKGLSEYKIDLVALCPLGCAYCSSNNGNFLRIRREPFAELTERQLGQRYLPSDEPSLTFVYDGVIEALAEELKGKPKSWGEGETLVLSMLTDGFSPLLVEQGITRAALDLLIERTSFRIRILTKRATVGDDPWIDYFLAHPGRFVVGLSCGTLDDDWARRIEIGTSPPSERLRALRRLQTAGVATFGMACPVFYDVLINGRIDELIDRTNASACEDFWVEPFNDRQNWRAVQKGYEPGTTGWEWMAKCFEDRRNGLWSSYATQLYEHFQRRAEAGGWLSKLHFLLYEHDITDSDAESYAGLDGVLLQSSRDRAGLSKHAAFRSLQLAE